MTSAASRTGRSRARARTGLSRIAAGVDGWPAGRDAAALGVLLAAAAGAELTLVAAVPDSHANRAWVGWRGLREEVEADLMRTRDSLAPGARALLKTDGAVARALEQVVGREGQDLLVVGSSRHAAEGHVRIGKRTRQLLGHADFALAIAPRGFHHHPPSRLTRIGVGFDAGPEADAALAFADGLAASSRSALHLRGVVDDRLAGSPAFTRTVLPEWEMSVRREAEWFDEHLAAAAAKTTTQHPTCDTVRGRPGSALLELSRDVDLLVVGSRRWGAAAALLLGSTGEVLVHDAACPILIVPRPEP